MAGESYTESDSMKANAVQSEMKSNVSTTDNLMNNFTNEMVQTQTVNPVETNVVNSFSTTGNQTTTESQVGTTPINSSPEVTVEDKTESLFE